MYIMWKDTEKESEPQEQVIIYKIYAQEGVNEDKEQQKSVIKAMNNICITF